MRISEGQSEVATSPMDIELTQANAGEMILKGLIVVYDEYWRINGYRNNR
jgi:hypothetical protein